ncbi:hypothetical protein FF38_05603 [Lucilia cuprina]|uniref:Uncharacterized protein n=1 Tax=Lucilia cuprina TaxID=7375 RepID=A0A0L0BV14_LUCCU|nr:hypothetical protein FF38_05603 [Lucilia cuprina]
MSVAAGSSFSSSLSCWVLVSQFSLALQSFISSSLTSSSLTTSSSVITSNFCSILISSLFSSCSLPNLPFCGSYSSKLAAKLTLRFCCASAISSLSSACSLPNNSLLASLILSTILYSLTGFKTKYFENKISIFEKDLWILRLWVKEDHRALLPLSLKGNQSVLFALPSRVLRFTVALVWCVASDNVTVFQVLHINHMHSFLKYTTMNE